MKKSLKTLVSATCGLALAAGVGISPMAIQPAFAETVPVNYTDLKGAPQSYNIGDVSLIVTCPADARGSISLIEKSVDKKTGTPSYSSIETQTCGSSESNYDADATTYDPVTGTPNYSGLVVGQLTQYLGKAFFKELYHTPTAIEAANATSTSANEYALYYSPKTSDITWKIVNNQPVSEPLPYLDSYLPSIEGIGVIGAYYNLTTAQWNAAKKVALPLDTAEDASGSYTAPASVGAINPVAGSKVTVKTSILPTDKTQLVTCDRKVTNVDVSLSGFPAPGAKSNFAYNRIFNKTTGQFELTVPPSSQFKVSANVAVEETTGSKFDGTYVDIATGLTKQKDCSEQAGTKIVTSYPYLISYLGGHTGLVSGTPADVKVVTSPAAGKVLNAGLINIATTRQISGTARYNAEEGSDSVYAVGIRHDVPSSSTLSTTVSYYNEPWIDAAGVSHDSIEIDRASSNIITATQNTYALGDIKAGVYAVWYKGAVQIKAVGAGNISVNFGNATTPNSVDLGEIKTTITATTKQKVGKKTKAVQVPLTTPKKGQTLKAAASSQEVGKGVSAKKIKYSYVWTDGFKILSTKATYKVAAKYAGRKLYVVTVARYTSKNEAGVSQTYTAPTQTTDTSGAFWYNASAKISKLTVKGTFKTGKKLTAKVTLAKGLTADSKAKPTYQWLRDGKNIKKATKATYKLTKADKGHKVTVKATVTVPGLNTATKTFKAKKVK